MQFSGVLGFISDLLPFVQAAERVCGAGAGKAKRDYVLLRLRTMANAATQRLGVLNELDPAVKDNRETLIDLAVDEAKFFGDLPATEDQRMKAGLALGFVADDDALSAYRNLQAGRPLSASQKKSWEDYRKSLPKLPEEPQAIPSDDPPAAHHPVTPDHLVAPKSRKKKKAA